MEKHDFQPKPMSPEEFLAKLKELIARMKKHETWDDLPFFTKSRLSLLDDDFARMMEPIIGKDLRK